MDAAKQYGLFVAAALLVVAGFAVEENWQLVCWLGAGLVAASGVTVHSARWGIVSSAVLAFGCASYLFSRKLDSASGPSLCNVNEVLNCDVVNSSAASELFGIPVALLGMGFYGGLVIAALTKEGTTARFFRIDVVFAVVNLLFSVYLAWQSKVIGALCVMCITMYLSHGIMLWAGLKGLKELDAPLGEDLGKAATSSVMMVIAAAFVVVTLVGQSVWRSSEARSGTGRITEDGVQTAASSSGGAPDAGTLSQLMGRPGGPIELDGTEHILGDPEAPYVVVEWADYGCPHCAMAAKELKILVQERPDIQVRFKTFPLSGACNPLIENQQGAERCKAAWAAECAGQQGRFWDLQGLIFANQTHISDEDLAFMAQQAGLDFPAWETCMQDQSVMEGVVADAIAGAKAGVQGTPALFVRGLLPDGQWVEACRGPAAVLELVEAHKAGVSLPAPQPTCFDPHGH